MDLKIGDIVGRKSYGCDVIFKIHDILKQGDSYTIFLKGMNLRILADAPENDLIKLSQNRINEGDQYCCNAMRKANVKLAKFNKRLETKIGSVFQGRATSNVFKRPGKVLHLDGDSSYLEMCLKSYKESHVEAIGRAISEIEQPKKVQELLRLYNPDILVLTGHDAMLKERNNRYSRNTDEVSKYRNSQYFIEAVKEARKYEPSLDSLVIFAGACQSYFEGIMLSGANFASAPERVLIHALDPVIICKSVAYASIDRIIPLEEMLNNTITGMKGIGGIQTRGKYRDGMPKTLNDTL
jgi:spore coat assembly protein